MSGGFVKLDSGILDSSIWAESPETRIVWLTMLAMAGSDGLVPATAPGISRAARIPIEAVRTALATFEAPDPDSRTLDHDGRRIQRVDGGYLLLNYSKYRDRDYTAAERMRRYRQRHSVTAPLRSVTQAEAEAEAEAEGRKEPPDLPPADRAERAIRQSTDALRTRLYALVSEMVEADPKQRDPTELMRLVTAYEKQDGSRVRGVVNAALLSHERVERSIADAEAQLEEWRQPDGPGA